MSAGSFLDGGGSRPMQRAALELLEPESAMAEARAIQRVFGKKRDMMLSRLTAMGVRVERPPEGTFYVWGSVRHLPAPLNTGMGLFRNALDSKVICVPGEFFDVNPGRRRMQHSRFRHHVRFSFGPNDESLSRGLDRLEALIRSHE